MNSIKKLIEKEIEKHRRIMRSKSIDGYTQQKHYGIFKGLRIALDIMSKNNFIDIINQFKEDIKPYLDDTFDSVFVDFKHNKRNYTIAITDESAFNEMMEILHDAYVKREAGKNLN